MSGVAGLRGTGDWGTDERPKDFRENILFFNPNGESPIFALTAKAGKRVVKDPEFAWWCEGNALVRVQTTSTTVAATDTLINLQSADPTATTLGANYGTGTMLKPGDLLVVEPATSVAETQAYAPELMEVDAVLSDTQITVKRGAGGSTAGSIPGPAWFTLIGSSYAEGTGAPKAVSRNPIKFFNYTQIFKNTYELTGTADKTKARTGDAWSNDKKRKAYDHSRDIEMSILFGRRFEGTGDNGKPKRTFGGLRTFIPAANTTIFSSPTTTDSFASAVSPVFDFNTGAGDTRIMFCGNAAALELGKIFNAATNVRLNSQDRVKVYGIHFQEMILPQGRILIKTHPLMSRHGIYQKSAFVIDFDALKWAPLDGRDTKAKDDVQTEDEDVRRGFFMTEGGIEVDYGGLTMAYLGNISKT
jgi:Family of unknown function (DUF5309)